MRGEPTISLCMIVRDEAGQLERCLSSVAGAVDELIVVDTGSQDATVAIAERFGARVLHHRWNDHFAEARNVGVDAATGDWVVYLDADEALVAEDRGLLRELARDDAAEGYTFLRRNRLAEDAPPTATNRTLRMFRRRPQHRFSGRIHEGVSEHLPAAGVRDAPVRIEHFGFDPRVRAARDKAARNLALLERVAREEPASAFTEANLGAEFFALGDVARAAGHLSRAVELLGDARPPFARPLWWRLVTALRMTGRLDEADAAAREATRRLPELTELWLEWAQVARERGDLEEAERLARHCLALGDAPDALGGVVGAGTFRAAAVLAAVLRERGDAAGAQEILHGALGEQPEDVALVSALVGAMLARGAAPEEVEPALRAAIGGGPLPAAMRLAAAQALREAGAAAAATAQLAAIEAEAPESDAARLAAAERALDAGDWAAGAQAAAGVPETSPLAGPAATAAAVGHALAGDRAAARAATDAARRAGAADAAALLDAWLGGDATIAPAALDLLALTFERALAAGDVDRAVEVLALFDRVDGLDPRTRRELLAHVYLRQGLLESAADEWVAAAQEHGPDAAALGGLARVAAAQGRLDDARLFAEGALELEPGAVAAQAVLVALRERGA